MLLPDSLFDVVARFLESVFFCWKERKKERKSAFCMEDEFSILILILSRCLGQVTSLKITLSKVIELTESIGDETSLKVSIKVDHDQK
jgi:hypothetical protein